MKITKDTLYRTVYMNLEKTELLYFLLDKDTGAGEQYFTDCHPEGVTWNKILDIWSLDEIQKSSDEYADEQARVNLEIEAFTKAQGYTKEQLAKIVNSDYDTVTAEGSGGDLTIEKIANSDISEELLFKLKLALFEQKEVQDSDNTEMKAKLRKAEKIHEIFYFYCQIIGFSD